MKKILFCSLLTLWGASWAFAQAALQPAAIVNIVRREPITVGQLRTEVQRMEQGTGRTLNAQERREVLDVMINERLALQAAERDKITVTDNEINQQITQIQGQMAQVLGRQPTNAEFAAALKNETGLEVAEYREHLKRQLTVQRYLMTKKASTLENIRVPTESEIQSTYNLTKAQLTRPDTVRLSMIIVPFGQDAASKTRAQQTANGLAREIGSNASKFDEVALRGRNANSGFRSGEDYVPRNMEAAQVMGQAFIDTAFGLRQGQVSQVIEGRMGYMIVKVTETYSQKSLELDDIFQLGSDVTVRMFIGNSMLQQRQMEALTQATQELATELRAGRNAFEVFERNLTW